MDSISSEQPNLQPTEENIVGKVAISNTGGNNRKADDKDMLVLTVSKQEFLKALLNPAGLPFNFSLSHQKGNRTTSLHLAVSEGSLAAIRQLLLQGSDPNEKDLAGATPIHLACQEGFPVCLELLLNAGGDANILDAEEKSPLHVAVNRRKCRCTKILLTKGADPNVPNKLGNSALHLAAYVGDYHICRLLLNNGADVNLPEKDRWTPLHYAGQEGHKDVTRLLLEHGANPNLLSSSLHSPIHCAAWNNRNECIRVLAEHKADVNIRTADGATALHYAAEKRLTSCVAALLDCGADIMATNKFGYTALDVAFYYHQDFNTNECAKLLKRRLEVFKSKGKKETPPSLKRKSSDAIVAKRAKTTTSAPERWMTSVGRVSAENLCRVCLSEEIRCVLLECGHYIACGACARSLRKCPICRRPVFRTVTVYK